MPADEVIAGCTYKHDKTGTVMRVEAASAPDYGNNVRLVLPAQFCKDGFIYAWRGKWETFKAQWTILKKQKNPYKPGDWVILKVDVKDGYGDKWHDKGDRVQVKSIAEDGEGLFFSSQLGVHFSEVKRCPRRAKK